MLFKLTYPQHIVIRDSCVYYYHNPSHGVVLTRTQFYNLNDILHAPLRLMSYPLGGGACLMWLQGEMRLQTKTGFFTFYRNSWHNYKRRVHRRIHFILRHGGRARGEPDAYHEVSHHDGSQTPASAARWHSSQWSARNARVSHRHRTKHASLPQRDRANSWRSVRRRRQRHVSRIREANAATFPSNDNIQSGDECSIEEETMSIEDCSQ